MPKAHVDANVILRFLLDDPPDMAKEATKLFQAVADGQITLMVDDLIVAEVIWVLKSFYKQSIIDIVAILREFLLQDGIELADKPTILYALMLFETKNVDFIDALVTARMKRAKAQSIFSFDKHFDRLLDVRRISPGKTDAYLAAQTNN